jgi:hypothetical protein
VLEQRARGEIAQHLSVFPGGLVNNVAALDAIVSSSFALRTPRGVLLILPTRLPSCSVNVAMLVMSAWRPLKIGKSLQQVPRSPERRLHVRIAFRHRDGLVFLGPVNDSLAPITGVNDSASRTIAKYGTARASNSRQWLEGRSLVLQAGYVQSWT